MLSTLRAWLNSFQQFWSANPAERYAAETAAGSPAEFSTDQAALPLNGKSERIADARSVEDILSCAEQDLERFHSSQLLRKLDAELAEAYLFFTCIELGPFPALIQPRGVLREDYDVYRHSSKTNHFISIPRYSSVPEDFVILEARVKSWYADSYVEILKQSGIEENRASLEQKCRAALQARSQDRSTAPQRKPLI